MRPAAAGWNRPSGWDIRWHGLACTTHTELMDRRLLDYDLSFHTCWIEIRHPYHRRQNDGCTRHTMALVSALCDAGIEFLHMGVNDSSRIPSVPGLFRWRAGEQEIVVNYSASYGESTFLENGTVLEFITPMIIPHRPPRKNWIPFTGTWRKSISCAYRSRYHGMNSPPIYVRSGKISP